MPQRGKDCPNCGQHFEKERDFTPLDPHLISSQDFQELREGLKHRAGPDLTPLAEGIRDIQAKLQMPSTSHESHQHHTTASEMLACPTCKPVVDQIIKAQPAHLPELEEIEDMVNDCPSCQKKWGAISDYVTAEARKGYVPESTVEEITSHMVPENLVKELLREAAKR